MNAVEFARSVDCAILLVNMKLRAWHHQYDAKPLQRENINPYM